MFGKALLQCLCCILPFLDKDLIDNLPYLVSSTMSVLPPALHQDIVNALCYYILPFTISEYKSITKAYFISIKSYLQQFTIHSFLSQFGKDQVQPGPSPPGLFSRVEVFLLLCLQSGSIRIHPHYIT